MTPTELFDAQIRACKTLDRAAVWLAGLMSEDCEIEANGTIRLFGGRQQVDRVVGLTISVLSREHPPPHFHVVGKGLNASFSISDGSHLAGELSPKQLRAVNAWYPRARRLLVQTWNETRPFNCPVGPIHDEADA